MKIFIGKGDCEHKFGYDEVGGLGGLEQDS